MRVCLVCVLNEILSEQQQHTVQISIKSVFTVANAISKVTPSTQSVSFSFSVVAKRNIRLTTVQYHTVCTLFSAALKRVEHSHTQTPNTTHNQFTPTIEEFCAPHKPITTFTIIRILSKKRSASTSHKKATKYKKTDTLC